jgi:hypothetical protein
LPQSQRLLQLEMGLKSLRTELFDLAEEAGEEPLKKVLEF